jgi:hypothetical protein
MEDASRLAGPTGLAQESAEMVKGLPIIRSESDCGAKRLHGFRRGSRLLERAAETIVRFSAIGVMKQGGAENLDGIQWLADFHEHAAQIAPGVGAVGVQFHGAPD